MLGQHFAYVAAQTLQYEQQFLPLPQSYSVVSPPTNTVNCIVFYVVICVQGRELQTGV